MPQQVPLRLLLVVPFVLQLLGTVGLVSYLAYRNGQRAVNNLASQLRDEVTARVEQQLTNYMSVPFLINQVVTNSFTQGNINVTQIEDSTILWQQASTFATTNLVYCGRESDGAFLGVGRGNDRDIRMLEVQFSNPDTNARFHYHPLDRQGKPGALDRVGDRPYDPRVRPWYQAAKTSGQPTWSQIYLDFDALVPVITASQPAYAPNGRLLGVCATDFLLSVELDTFLSSLQIGQSGEVFIIERDGTLVASSTSIEEDLLVGDGEDVQRLKMTESNNGLVRATGQFLAQWFGNLAHIDSARQLSFTLKDYTPLNISDDRQFVQITPFQDTRGLDWLIVMVVPEADFMSEIHAQNRNTALLSIAALTLATLVGILTARWISNPVLKLNEAAQSVADAARERFTQGRLVQPVSIQGITELEALSQSFNQMATQLQDSFAELEAANVELENRVEQRTHQLKEANDKITKLNQQLKADNLRMSTELDVAHHMQQLMLPRSQELGNIPGLDIAGFMEPATEMGGDYYDIIHSGDRTIVGIGDVTGHGLESSVLMIMVQSAVRALLAEANLHPVQFLNALNQMVYENTQRLSPGKNLTFAIVTLERGKLSICGQHEEVLIVRANGTVERIDTVDLGYPLGITPNISEWIAQTHVMLYPGDGAVLYTDGITEAEGCDRKLYGLDRLINVIQHHWHQPAKEVIDAVIHDVRSHTHHQPIRDDLTLIVLKQGHEESMRYDLKGERTEPTQQI
ncbi:SpoIIE family protein phosphatase [Leptolyngbya sp. AN02str]|uniref:SpoIIE family protein phosphatase n=1 Tax=Leptolyngbya sp. AN02str TaxID=3423363 RepID=UPI003D31ADED